jgi:branched-chain amino acid aminotransferase
MRETEKIWMNGELVDWADAKVHVGAHGLHYGTGVFEGIRCYETRRARRLPADRPPAAPAQLGAAPLHGAAVLGRRAARALHELIGANGLPECYLRPIAFYGYGELGVSTRDNPVDVVIMSWPWGAYLGDEGCRTASAQDLVLAADRAEHRSRTSRRRRASTSTRCSR